MKRIDSAQIAEAKRAALEVLRHNSRGPFHSLPRTAGWGYPEPYTRDMMISALGILASGDADLIDILGRVFRVLAANQTPRGHVPSLAHDPHNLGASDTTPLFLMALAIYRTVTGQPDFLEDAAQRALTWMEYQSPGDQIIIGHLPTTDWRDEQWVLGHGLFVNTIAYAYLRLWQRDEEAAILRKLMNQQTIAAEPPNAHIHEALVSSDKPYYPLWKFKAFNNERFDLLGNSLAIITGMAPPERARGIIRWIEEECAAMRERGDLALDLCPNLAPVIRRTDADWRPRYEKMNQPGDYHNGGVWPFVSGFHVVAALAAGFPEIAEARLMALTDAVFRARDESLPYGFNEWHKAQTGAPSGNDWQTWSAAMYLYAAECVERGRVLYFEEIREDKRKAA